jgi:phospholipase C
VNPPNGISSGGIDQFWSPAPSFLDLSEDSNPTGSVLGLSDFYNALINGTLPSVSWIVPGENVSEHAGLGGVDLKWGEGYVTALIQSIMSSSSWSSSLILLSWDDWGGLRTSSITGNTATIRI